MGTYHKIRRIGSFIAITINGVDLVLIYCAPCRRCIYIGQLRLNRQTLAIPEDGILFNARNSGPLQVYNSSTALRFQRFLHNRRFQGWILIG